ncbi:hypothetical protein GQ53DRAFT_783163 [Thozetella sp. PMI_491]|nr:hypothetical protein GQ53DRAFT_783163 [Thozetella sp. PMI_491]
MKYIAPGAENAKRVLGDAGAGTGIWAIGFADAHPAASPSWTPPNCIFGIDDLGEQWNWGVKFDYTFARSMVGSFADWSKFMEKAYDNLEPGRWLELVDPIHPMQRDDSTLMTDHALKKWNDDIMQGSEALGRSLTEAKHLKERLVEVWFVNIKKGVFSQGGSPDLMTRGRGFTAEEVMAYLVDVMKHLRDPKIHAYWPIWVVYGQKTNET